MAIIAGGGGGTPTPTPQPSGGGGGAAAAAQAALQAAQAGGGAAGMATPYQIPVRMGDYSRPTNRGQFDDNIHTSGPHTSQLAPLISRFNLDDGGLQQAYGAWYTFDDAERSKIMKKMWFLGLLKNGPDDFDGAYKVWSTAVEHASRFAMMGKEIDPRDVLDIMGNATQAEKDRQAARGVAGGTFTQKSTSIDLTDPSVAKAFITQAFQQSMGRDPQDAEIRSMMDALSRQEKANPKVTTTTTKYGDNGMPVDTNSTTSGGLNAEAYVSAQASADPEAGAHQAASQLFPALMQALQAPPT